MNDAASLTGLFPRLNYKPTHTHTAIPADN